ncbi:hypothetical protein M8J76_009324 [Diaphorina citri]|nr:hypothetical protein M8J76_009324 [Diaphorina citri]
MESSLLNYPTGFGLSQCPTKPIGSSLVNYARGFGLSQCPTKPMGSSLLNYPTGFGLSQCPTKPIGSSLVNYARGFGLSQCPHQALGGFGLSPRYSTKPIGSCLLISQRLCLLTRLSVIKPLGVGVSLSGATNINPLP